MNADIGIVGGGPSGLLMALLLAQRGRRVSVYERRQDPRTTAPEAGRSINLALAARGLQPLAAAGVLPALQDLLVPMRGREVHNQDGSSQFIGYGQDAREAILSISRSQLTRRLAEAAGRDSRIRLNFGQRALGIEGPAGMAFADEQHHTRHLATAGRWIGADGAGSALRQALVAEGATRFHEAPLGHDYKELTLPALAGTPLLKREALHIWPRGDFMLIALPNADDSFTMTLFLPREGPSSFATLNRRELVAAFFQREFPDVAELLPDHADQFMSHPQGRLATLYSEPWNLGERFLLIGDAAHAIVPFHGQGMNCAFEDCVVLDSLLAQDPRGDAFDRFSRLRKPDADAIAQMALENYAEMRDGVRDPRFLLQKELSLELERRFPERFVPRYSMVMFHAEIRYSVALSRGRIQQQILDELTAPEADGSLPAIARIDWTKAQRLVSQRLDPL